MEDPTAAAPAQSAAQVSPAELELHAAAAIFPALREPEFEALVADIREHGQLEAIWTYQGKVIDGRHRLLACKKLGLTPRTREWDGHGSLMEFVISANLRRRHLKENQRAMIAARMLPHFEAEALKRKQAGGKVVDSNHVANLPHGHARDLVGKYLNISGRSVETARKVLQGGIPDLIARVDAGTLAVSLAAKVAELPPDEQVYFVNLSRAAIVEKLRTWHPAAVKQKPKTAAQLAEEQKIARMIQRTQLGPGTQLSNTPQGLRLELTYANGLMEFYHLNSDRELLRDLLDRGVFIVRRPQQAS